MDENPTIEEYKTTKIKKLDKRDWDYLEKSYFRIKNQKFFKVYVDRHSTQCIDNTSAAGLIQLSDRRLYFKTKVDTRLFYMLRFLKSEKDFLYDPDSIIEIEDGDNFFDIIVRLFLTELKKIIKTGLLQKYVRKYENLDELKGGLDIERQMQNDINDIFKFSCAYSDLTVDNAENRIVLKALDVLIPVVRFDKNLRKQLKMYEYLLKEGVKLVDLSPEDCDNISFDVTNDYYVSILRLSKVILNKSFIKSVHEGRSVGFNFIVNMNTVFQDFITQMINDVINENSEFSKFEAKNQKEFRSFIEGSNEKPDVSLKIKGKRLYPFPIELKYKIEKKVKKADHVQAAVYGTNLPGARLGCIICAKDREDNIGRKSKQINKNMMKNESEKIPLLIYKIDLYIDDKLIYGDYINKIKDQIKTIILDLMEETNFEF